METENWLEEDDINEKFVDEIVIVTRGKNKGRIGYCDDTASDKKCYVTFGDPLIAMNSEITVLAKSLRIATTDDLLDRSNFLWRKLTLDELSYNKRVTFLEEYILISNTLSENMIKAKFLQGKEGKKVFISYSSKDYNFAIRLSVDLSKFGHSPWLDEFKILVGQSIPEKISIGLQDCDFVLVLLSNNSIKSHWVEREWQTKYWNEIETGKIKVIPILTEDCEIPQLLKTKKYADFRGNNYSKALSNLLLALKNY
jgi:hypothetical protein